MGALDNMISPSKSYSNSSGFKKLAILLFSVLYLIGAPVALYLQSQQLHQLREYSLGIALDTLVGQVLHSLTDQPQPPAELQKVQSLVKAASTKDSTCKYF